MDRKIAARRVLPGVAACAAAGLGAVAPAWAQQYPQYYGTHMWHGGWHGWLFGPLMMILFIAAIVVVVVLLVRWLGGAGHGHAHHAPPGKTPLDILKERFARGEIDLAEFEERKKALGD